MKSMIRFLVVLIWFSPALAAAQFAPCSVAPLPYLVTTPSQPTASQVLKVTIAEFNFIPRRTEPEVGGRLHLQYAQPTKPACTEAELLEHVWNALLGAVDVAITSMPSFCYERE